jgi:hypothetical protein
MLLVTSSDCYCSIITFEPDELGNPSAPGVSFQSTQVDDKALKSSEVSECSPHRPVLITATTPVSDNSKSSSTPKLNSHMSQSVSPTSKVSSPSGKPRRIRPTMISAIDPKAVSSPDKNSGSTTQDVTSSQIGTLEAESQPPATTTATKVPRRVQLITLSSYKKNHPPSNES